MKSIVNAFCSAVIALSLSAHASAGEDAGRGQELYQARCSACHSLDVNRVGPRHRGVFGRKAGSVADYRYSPALKSAGIIWDESTLERWLSDPESVIPGQRMGYRTGPAEDRRDLIAFLRRESR